MKINLILIFILLFNCNSSEKKNISKIDCALKLSINSKLIYYNIEGTSKYSIFIISNDDFVQYLYKFNDGIINLCLQNLYKNLEVVIYIEDTNRFKKNIRYSTFNEIYNQKLISLNRIDMLARFRTKLQFNETEKKYCYKTILGEEFDYDFEYYIDHIFPFNYIGGKYPYRIYKVYLNSELCVLDSLFLKTKNWKKMNGITGEINNLSYEHN